MAIFIEAHEETVKEMGYTSDFKDIARWEYKNYLYWMVEWLPERPLTYLKKKIGMKAIYDDDAQLENDKEEKDKMKEQQEEGNRI